MVKRHIATSKTLARAETNTPQETVVRTVEYVRNEANGALMGVTLEPDSQDPSLHLETTYHRNPAGQVDVTTQTSLDPNVPRRKTTVTYDPTSGVYPYVVTNAVGQPSILTYHPGLGVLAQAEDPNGLKTTSHFDGFGRLTRQQRPDGGGVVARYRGNIDAGLPLTVETETMGGLSIAGYDNRGQEVVNLARDEMGNFNQTRVDYDRYGRAVARWRPYPQSQIGNEDALPHYVYAYDNLGRVRFEELPPGRTEWTYSCRTTTRTVKSSSGDQTDDSTEDELGRLSERVERVTDPDNRGAGPHEIRTRYFYGPFQLPEDVIDTAGNVTHIEYDIRGRRRLIRDPDSGTETDSPDAFDQIALQRDANLQTVTMRYDALGRPLSESTTEGTNFFVWDIEPNGKGQLAATFGRDDVNIGYKYNDKGQRSAEEWTISGGAPIRLDYEFDPIGRASFLHYPTVGSSRYVVQFTYAPGSGELKSVLDPNGSELWRVDTRNPERRITQETFGDGVVTLRGYEPQRGILTSLTAAFGLGTTPIQEISYTYDDRGYMQTRSNYLAGDLERFNHDELGRLTS
jgi:YD repeat-containing protein